MKVLPVKVILGVNGYGYIAKGEVIKAKDLVYVDDNWMCCHSGKYIVGIAASDSDEQGVIVSRFFIDEETLNDIRKE